MLMMQMIFYCDILVLCRYHAGCAEDCQSGNMMVPDGCLRGKTMDNAPMDSVVFFTHSYWLWRGYPLHLIPAAPEASQKKS